MAEANQSTGPPIATEEGSTSSLPQKQLNEATAMESASEDHNRKRKRTKQDMEEDRDMSGDSGRTHEQSARGGKRKGKNLGRKDYLYVVILCPTDGATN
jgi:hypothetical protein